MAAWTGWETDVLKYGSWPVTPQNVLFLDTWHTYEGSNCTNNPLNTTLKLNRSTNCVHVSGSIYVQAYPSKTQGKIATVSTLKGPFYGAIVDALASGDPFSWPGSQTVAAEIRQWGKPLFATWYLSQVGVVGVPPPAPGAPPGSVGAVAPHALRGFADLRNSVRKHLPKQLERSRRTGLVTLRAIGRTHKVKG